MYTHMHKHTYAQNTHACAHTHTCMDVRVMCTYTNKHNVSFIHIGYLLGLRVCIQRASHPHFVPLVTPWSHHHLVAVHTACHPACRQCSSAEGKLTHVPLLICVCVWTCKSVCWWNYVYNLCLPSLPFHWPVEQVICGYHVPLCDPAKNYSEWGRASFMGAGYCWWSISSLVWL